MSDTVIKIENLSKLYRLGLVSTGTLRHDLNRFWAKIRGKEDPFLKIGETNDRTTTGGSDYVLALKDINLEVKRGERIGIIGKNGAGKSTLLKILSQVTGPTTGRIKIKGRTGSLLEVGTGFHPELTGRENIYMNGTILGMTHREVTKKLDEIVDFAGVERYLDTPVKRYSSGMMVRLGFAVAAHLEPDILIVDEVLAVGDAEFQKKAIGKMKDVSEGHGRTILFVSHNMTAIKNLCSKAVMLKNGIIKKAGLTSEVINHYLHHNQMSDGRIEWESDNAPGDSRIKLKSVEVISDGKATGTPSVGKDIKIKLTYINYESGVRRLISFHVLNSMNQILFTSANTKSASLKYDSWVDKDYPPGDFATSCTVPANLLNPGQHSVNLYLNGSMSSDSIIKEESIISFEVKDTAEWRTDYLGEWIGAVRPKLLWQTEKIEYLDKK